MANDKFEPMGTISDIEVRLECLRLATEFGPEFERKDPLCGKSIRLNQSTIGGTYYEFYNNDSFCAAVFKQCANAITTKRFTPT